MTLEFLLTINCIECKNLQYKYGLCHNHYSVSKCDNILNILYSLNTDELNEYNTKIKTKIKMIKNMFRKIKCEIKKNYKNLQYVTNVHITDKYKFLSKYDYTSLIQYTYKEIIEEYNNLINDYEYKQIYEKINIKIPNIENELIYLLYEHKLLKNKSNILYKIILHKNDMNYKKIVSANTHSLNSYKLFRSLINNNIKDKILLLTCEYKIKIINRTAVFDLYMIICTKNNIYLEAIIEIDENHHMNKDINMNKQDIIKDLYCFNKSISLLRISTNDITDNIVEKVINFINCVYNQQKPIYILDDLYIFHKNNMINNYILNYDKKYNITSYDYVTKKDDNIINENNKGILIDIDTYNEYKNILENTDSDDSNNSNISNINNNNNISSNNGNNFIYNNMKITFGSIKSKKS